MYSRFSKSSERPIQLPEHYSGCAFSETDEKEPRMQNSPPPTPPSHQKEPSTEPREHSPILSKPFSLSLPGLDSDQLLLIGLMILLSHSEQENDLIPWLVLLLFCK